jgi:hypothetical protein
MAHSKHVGAIPDDTTVLLGASQQGRGREIQGDAQGHHLA